MSFNLTIWSFFFFTRCVLYNFRLCIELREFQENYTAPRMVLSASGVEHEEFLAIAEPLLSDLPAVPRPVEPKSVYVGGDFRCQANSPVCTMGITYDISFSSVQFCHQFTRVFVSLIISLLSMVEHTCCSCF